MANAILIRRTKTHTNTHSHMRRSVDPKPLCPPMRTRMHYVPHTATRLYVLEFNCVHFSFWHAQTHTHTHTGHVLREPHSLHSENNETSHTRRAEQRFEPSATTPYVWGTVTHTCIVYVRTNRTPLMTATFDVCAMRVCFWRACFSRAFASEMRTQTHTLRRSGTF